MPEVVIGWVLASIVVSFGLFLFTRRRLPGGFVSLFLVTLIGAAVAGYFYAASDQVDILQGRLNWGMLVVAGVGSLITGVIVLLQAPRRQPKDATPVGTRRASK